MKESLRFWMDEAVRAAKLLFDRNKVTGSSGNQRRVSACQSWPGGGR